jgi:hypothetical protein
MVALTKHAANRILEREIPFEAIDACRMVAPILNKNPLRFRYRDLVIVARKAGASPRIISVWRAE